MVRARARDGRSWGGKAAARTTRLSDETYLPLVHSTRLQERRKATRTLHRARVEYEHTAPRQMTARRAPRDGNPTWWWRDGCKLPAMRKGGAKQARRGGGDCHSAPAAQQRVANQTSKIILLKRASAMLRRKLFPGSTTYRRRIAHLSLGSLSHAHYSLLES